MGKEGYAYRDILGTYGTEEDVAADRADRLKKCFGDAGKPGESEAGQQQQQQQQQQPAGPQQLQQQQQAQGQGGVSERRPRLHEIEVPRGSHYDPSAGTYVME